MLGEKGQNSGKAENVLLSSKCYRNKRRECSEICLAELRPAAADPGEGERGTKDRMQRGAIPIAAAAAAKKTLPVPPQAVQEPGYFHLVFRFPFPSCPGIKQSFNPRLMPV